MNVSGRVSECVGWWVGREVLERSHERIMISALIDAGLSNRDVRISEVPAGVDLGPHLRVRPRPRPRVRVGGLLSGAHSKCFCMHS